MLAVIKLAVFVLLVLLIAAGCGFGAHIVRAPEPAPYFSAAAWS